jgi:hypothetical protein
LTIGSIEAVASALTIAHGVIPPTADLTERDREIHIEVVTGTSRLRQPGPALCSSFGFGGHNRNCRDGAPALTEFRPPSGQGPPAGQALRCFRSRAKAPR